MIELKGIAWDHPRGYEPLRAASQVFSNHYPNISIKWDIRSLKEFGDTPIEDLIDAYDFITVDHPYMGQAAKDELLLPLNKNISNSILEALADQYVGPSFQSYQYNEHLYALPIDAAALVAAYRADLLKNLGLCPPQTRTELKKFYKEIPNGYSVAWPLCATDLWCSFLTLCAQDGGHDFIKDNKIDENLGSSVLDELKYHLEYLHPKSIQWNPIQVLDQMGQEEKIIYSPYLFGYTNYGRKGYSKHRLDFSNSPINAKNNISTILGGVGLAISSKCSHVSEALKYLDYVTNANTQKGLYTKNAGQPAGLEAWENKENNILCNNFFKNTMKTMNSVYVRPQYPGWNLFQEQGAELLHKGLQKDIPSNKLIRKLNELATDLFL
ncbi:MAG: ABC transporter substrate-binding protein [Cellulophaga sp.]